MEKKEEDLPISSFADEAAAHAESPPLDTINKSLRSDKLLIITIALIALFLAGIVGYFAWQNSQPLPTIEDLHMMNIRGELDEGEGFVYRDTYSFILLDGFWYTQLLSQQGSSQYNLPFRFSPNEVENIRIGGYFDPGAFDNATSYYVTFNPLAPNQSYTVLAVNDLNQQMVSTFKKMPIAACDRNETSACKDVAIVTCETPGVVFYINHSSRQSIDIDGTCIVINGNGFDLVKGIDRVLYSWYGIME